MNKRNIALPLAAALLAGAIWSAVAQSHWAGSGCTHYHDGTNRILCNNNDNTFSGTDTRDVVWAYSGNDTGHGYGGDDEIHGAAGDDFLRGGGGRDDIYGGEGGIDRLHGGDGADDLFDRAGAPWYAPWSDEVDVICAGVDTHLDQVDVRDDDTLDRIYVDKGEDDYFVDMHRHLEVLITDLVYPASECPFHG